MTATINTIRDPIRDRVEAAAGITEPLVVTTSSSNLAAIRDRVEARLQDASNATWPTDDLDEATRTALEQYSKYNPHHVIGTRTLGASDAREIDISSLTGLMRVEYAEEQGTNSGIVLRIFHTTGNTISGLDSATETTLIDRDVSILVLKVHCTVRWCIAPLTPARPPRSGMQSSTNRT